MNRKKITCNAATAIIARIPQRNNFTSLTPKKIFAQILSQNFSAQKTLALHSAPV